MDAHPQTPNGRAEEFELFAVSVVGTLVFAVAVLVAVSWKHLRAKAIAPADTPIIVE
jgi:hypothetical protein